MNNGIFNNPDLHIHSVFSDGTDTPEELIKNVKNAGIDIFALTDHDSYSGCAEIKENLKAGDPYFIGGIELSCKDEFGKYHILGYCYDIHKKSIVDAVELTHNSRFVKARHRIDYLESIGYKFEKEDLDYLFSLNNPGKPHIANLMIKKGYADSIAEGIKILSGCKYKELYLSPKNAVEAILNADGIPVLAHGILADGSKKLSFEEIEDRVKRLKSYGLMGLECYYSGFSDEQKEIMISLAHKYNLLITAGSDYHGANKKVKLGQTNNPAPEEMERFYKVVSALLKN